MNWRLAMLLAPAGGILIDLAGNLTAASGVNASAFEKPRLWFVRSGRIYGSADRKELKMRLTIPSLLIFCSALHAQTSDPLKKLDFLLGEWIGIAGEKDTPLGAGQGSFTFEPQLKQKIIVRRNSANYASGAQHDDLMVIYADAGDPAPRAIYFDTEGHVIRYMLAFPSPNRVIFESDATQPGPRFRLTYWMEGASLYGRFEVAAPGSEYKTYLNWTSKKR